MTAKIIDGNEAAKALQLEIASQIKGRVSQGLPRQAKTAWLAMT